MPTITTDEHNKVKDLCRVYGASELCDYLGVDKATVSLALKSDSEIADASVKHIRSGIRLYWKAWMGEHRNFHAKPERKKSALDKHYKMITVEEAMELRKEQEA